MARAARPCWRELPLVRAFPARDFGPVLFLALARSPASCRSLAIAVRLRPLARHPALHWPALTAPLQGCDLLFSSRPAPRRWQAQRTLQPLLLQGHLPAECDAG